MTATRFSNRAHRNAPLRRSDFTVKIELGPGGKVVGVRNRSEEQPVALEVRDCAYQVLRGLHFPCGPRPSRPAVPAYPPGVIIE